MPPSDAAFLGSWFKDDRLSGLGCGRQRFRRGQERWLGSQPQPGDQRHCKLDNDNRRDHRCDDEYELGSGRLWTMGNFFRAAAAWRCCQALENERRSVGYGSKWRSIGISRRCLHVSSAHAAGTFDLHGRRLCGLRSILLSCFGNMVEYESVASWYERSRTLSSFAVLVRRQLLQSWLTTSGAGFLCQLAFADRAIRALSIF